MDKKKGGVYDVKYVLLVLCNHQLTLGIPNIKNLTYKLAVRRYIVWDLGLELRMAMFA